MFNLFGAYGYTRKTSDRFFNTMDTDRSGTLSLQEFGKHFGPSIQPEYEQDRSTQGYMVTTHNFYYDSKNEYMDDGLDRELGMGNKC